MYEISMNDINQDIVGKIEDISFEYTWTIDNFHLRSECVENILKSPVFTPLDISNNRFRCQLWLYPRGTAEVEEYLSIFLYVQGNETIRAAVMFQLLNNQGETIEGTIHSDCIFDAVTENSYVGGIFVRRDFLEDSANNVLSDNKLKIACKIILRQPHDNSVVISVPTCTRFNPKRTKIHHEIESFSQDRDRLITDLEELIDDQEFSDVQLMVEGKTLRAHQGILSKRSSAFAAMLKKNVIFENGVNKLEITDVSYEIFLEVLRYIYTGKINNIEPVAAQLLAAAYKYKLDFLKLMCEISLGKSLETSNVVNTLKFADEYDAVCLKAKAIAFIVTNSAIIINTPEFKQLTNNLLLEVCFAMADKTNRLYNEKNHMNF